MSEQHKARDVDAIVRRAQRDALRLWREEHAHRRRQLTFLTGGLVAGAAAALVASALLPAPSALLLLAAALMLLMALWQLVRWWRCPRCERGLWHASALGHGARALWRPTGCPHCGLRLEGVEGRGEP